MRLISEIVNDDVICETTISEGTNDKEYKIHGIFLQSEIKNRNGRIYPKSILEKQVETYVNEYIKNRRSLGELNHPQTPVVDSANASHLITELVQENSNFIGTAKILSTPRGKIVKALMDDNVAIGVSSRGVGTLKKNSAGITEVCNDYQLKTVDIVSDPSGPDCWVNGIMESVDWIFNEGNGWKAIQFAEKTQKIIKTKKNLSENQKLKLFQNFMNSI